MKQRCFVPDLQRMRFTATSYRDLFVLHMVSKKTAPTVGPNRYRGKEQGKKEKIFFSCGTCCNFQNHQINRKTDQGVEINTKKQIVSKVVVYVAANQIPRLDNLKPKKHKPCDHDTQ